MGINSVTGDNIISKHSTKYADNFDAIFRKNKDVPPTQDVGNSDSTEQGPLPRHGNGSVQHFLAGEGIDLGEHYY